MASLNHFNFTTNSFHQIHNEFPSSSLISPVQTFSNFTIPSKASSVSLRLKSHPLRLAKINNHSCKKSMESVSSSLVPLKIGIIGFGNFGQFLAKAFTRQGHNVVATSRSDYSDYCHKHGIEFCPSMDDLCEAGPDVVLVCSSILSTESIVRQIPFHKLKPDTIFADVLSVKQFPRNLFLEALPQEFGILCTHPMFGPNSGKHSWEGLRFVYEEARIAEGIQNQRCAEFLRIFQDEGCKMVEMSCEEHDRYAAGSQFVTHTVGRVLSELELESTPIDTRGYETLLELTENTVNDSFDLYYGLFMYNVNATEQIEKLDKAFETVKQKLFGRLHDVLRKQIVERKQIATIDNTREEASQISCFLPTNGVDDSSSFPMVPLQVIRDQSLKTKEIVQATR